MPSYSISVTGNAEDTEKVRAEYKAFLAKLQPLGAVYGSFYPSDAPNEGQGAGGIQAP